eukprot:GEMP01033541.1.p1 GENE.GEMP01033541.1~~GEMP01033541.1.p1  ORF type:complete len:449 (+),score=66.84 GEMP01033541.1:129-1349(+)
MWSFIALFTVVASMDVVDLSQPVNERWLPLLKKVQEENPGAISNFLMAFQKVLSQFELAHSDLRPRIGEIKGIIERRWPGFAEEERAVIQNLKDLGVSFDPVEFTEFNVFYAITHLSGFSGVKACTSMFGIGADGNIWHGRNFDYTPVETVNVTRQVHVMRNNKTVVKGTMHVPFPAYMTDGMNDESDDPFSFSVNQRNFRKYRNVDELIERLKVAAPAILLLRGFFEVCDTYRCAVNMALSTQVATEAYFLFAGKKEAVLIVKNIHGEDARVKYLSNQCHGPFCPVREGVLANYLVQTNFDYWEPDPAQDRRRTTIEHAISKLPKSPDLRTEFMKILTINDGHAPPMRKCIPGARICTLHSVVMSVATGVFDMKLPGAASAPDDTGAYNQETLAVAAENQEISII